MRALVISMVCACATTHPPRAATPVPAPAVAATPAPPPVTPPEHRLPSWIGARFDAHSTKVRRVISGAPAERGGLRVDDEVNSIDGKPVADASEIIPLIQGMEPGVPTRLLVTRQGAQIAVALTPEPKPEMMDVVRQAMLGKPAAAYAAENISGTYPATLADLRGNVVLVDFWATWCGPCAMTMPRLDAWQTSYGARGLRIVGLSSEDTAEISAFVAAHPLGYTIARDPGGKAAQDYLLQGVPMLVLIDKTGVIRDVFLGAGNFDAIEAAFVKLL